MTQSSPDLITELGDGLQVFNWIAAIEITRQGQTPMPGASGLEDRWQIACPVQASLAKDGQVLLRDGAEIAVAPTIAPVRVDVARILHDPRVPQAIALIRAVCLDLARGDLIPQPIAQPTTE